ncbi:hypothetical protein [Chitinivibrio alkaliphilus]|uniref:Uncharacterized protein n=1 Tax=Chitinivibrio alkaliphilus ACht1 TaxID=1313304 RepID=U7D7U8_9BACT|nr:hypothetical protein [Chitinivibrio alkaliphilus]ERP31167.1 hypothetical protein CALK_1966 [Chitinivibrio alkaliphilus ACht1]
MNKQEDLTHILTAEAHLYVGVAKADKLVSRREFAQTPYYAAKSQRFFDMFDMKEKMARAIGPIIRDILRNPAYDSWTSEEHLDEAVTHIEQAQEKGFWQVRIIFEKNAEGFLNTARIDGYNIQESRFIQRMEEKLAGLFEVR